MAQTELKDLLVITEHKVLKALLEIMEIMVMTEHKVLKALRAITVT
jgi:hypothetical protein